MSSDQHRPLRVPTGQTLEAFNCAEQEDVLQGWSLALLSLHLGSGFLCFCSCCGLAQMCDIQESKNNKEKQFSSFYLFHSLWQVSFAKIREITLERIKLIYTKVRAEIQHPPDLQATARSHP